MERDQAGESGMKIRASDSDYLSKASAISWADCQAKTPVVGTSGLGDTDYLFMGKDYTAPDYFIRQTFLRFDTSVIRNSHEIDSVTLRLYVETDGSDTDFTLTLIVLDSTYGTVDATDWVSTYTTYTTITVNDTNVETDIHGNDYIDIPFTAAMLAAIDKDSTTFDMALKANEVSEPTDGEYLKVYSHQYATATLRPYLAVVTKGLRQQMFEALETTLDTIDETDGYATTPEVSANFKGANAVTKTKAPAVFILADNEEREREPYQTDNNTWHVYLLAKIYSTSQSVLMQRINELIDDIEWCLGQNPQLGLSAGIIDRIRIQRLDTEDSLIIDDNYASALLTLEILYATHITET